MNANSSYRQMIDRHIKKLFNRLLGLKKCLNPDRLLFFFFLICKEGELAQISP